MGEGKISKLIGAASKLIFDSFSTKISSKVNDTRRAAIRALYALKKEFIRTIVEATLLVSALIALSAGLILLISKIVAIEYVLIGYGLIVLVFLFMQMKLR